MYLREKNIDVMKSSTRQKYCSVLSVSGRNENFLQDVELVHLRSLRIQAVEYYLTRAGNSAHRTENR